MVKLFGYLKGLAIIHWAGKALKILWPFLLIIIFWPEIDNMFSSFKWWNDSVGLYTKVIMDISNGIRKIPIVGDVIAGLGTIWDSIRLRILSIFSKAI